MTSSEHRAAAFQVVATVAELIRVLGSVPSGELYARVMGHMDIHNYNKIIEMLKGAGLVEERAFMLTWIGPNLVDSATKETP